MIAPECARATPEAFFPPRAKNNGDSAINGDKTDAKLKSPPPLDALDVADLTTGLATTAGEELYDPDQSVSFPKSCVTGAEVDFHETESDGGKDELSVQAVVVHPLIPRL